MEPTTAYADIRIPSGLGQGPDIGQAQVGTSQTLIPSQVELLGSGTGCKTEILELN